MRLQKERIYNEIKCYHDLFWSELNSPKNKVTNYSITSYTKLKHFYI
jgi:hypothetical protein